MIGGNLSPREKSLLIITLGIGVLAGVLRFVWMPFQEWKAAHASSYEEQYRTFRELEFDLERARALEEKVRELKKQVGNPNVRFAAPWEVSQVIAHIEKLSGENNVKFERYTPSAIDRSSSLSHFDVRMKGSARYRNIIEFLHGIEQAEFVMQPVDLRLTGAGKMELEIAVRVYLDRERKRGFEG